MKILLLVIGKTDEPYIETGLTKYISRIVHYAPFEVKVIADIKNRKALSEEQQKKAEGSLILAQLTDNDVIILLDENGKQFTSRQFSQCLERKMANSARRIVFVIGSLPSRDSRDRTEPCSASTKVRLTPPNSRKPFQP